jgi:hypothetical protein
MSIAGINRVDASGCRARLMGQLIDGAGAGKSIRANTPQRSAKRHFRITTGFERIPGKAVSTYRRPLRNAILSSSHGAVNDF